MTPALPAGFLSPDFVSDWLNWIADSNFYTDNSTVIDHSTEIKLQ